MSPMYHMKGVKDLCTPCWLAWDWVEGGCRIDPESLIARRSELERHLLGRNCSNRDARSRDHGRPRKELRFGLLP